MDNGGEDTFFRYQFAIPLDMPSFEVYFCIRRDILLSHSIHAGLEAVEIA